MARRLLEHLEEGVRGVAVHLVGAVDHHDPPAALRRRQVQEGADIPDVVDDDLGAQPPAFLVIAALDGEQVGMAACGDAPEHGMVGVDSKGLGRPLERPGAAARGQDETGEAEGERRLADAFGAGDEPGVGEMARAASLDERALGGRVAHELRIGPGRRRDLGRCVGPRRQSSTPRRSRKAAQIKAWVSASVPLASITTQRKGSRRAMSRKPSRRRR